MGFSLRSNMTSMHTRKILAVNQGELKQSLERLSSGYRINKAADDAAGLAISENLGSQIKSFDQARRNANDGVSMLQVAEGAMNEVSNVLIRLRELAVQASTDTLASRDRSFLNSEYRSLKLEIDRISETTEFNGTFLINGAISASGVDFQIGIEATANDRLNITIANSNTSSLGSTGSSTLSNTQLIEKTSARNALDVIDKAILDISERRSTMGSSQKRLSSTATNLSNSAENIVKANSQIKDVNIAEETAKFTRVQIFNSFVTSMMAQANQTPQMALRLLGGR